MLPLTDDRPGWASGPVAWLVRWADSTKRPTEGAGRPRWGAVGGEVGLRGHGERGRYRPAVSRAVEMAVTG